MANTSQKPRKTSAPNAYNRDKRVADRQFAEDYLSTTTEGTMTIEQIEARIEELVKVLEGDPKNKDAAREMTRLLSDHTVEINKFLYAR